MTLILYRVTGLKVVPMNIAIPTSLIIEDEEGQLQFTTYIQLTDGFLSKKQLELALMVYKSFKHECSIHLKVLCFLS